MPDRPGDKRPTLLELMTELERLAEEQRTVDFRDTAAVEAYQRKLEALRQKIKLLNA
jgi:hypothetical protein